MSEFSVHRTADTIPALKYCLILDGERIAGGKPDYRGDNYLISWNTRETYGPVNQLKAENAKLRKLCGFMLRCMNQYHDCADCLVNGEQCEISHIESDARDLGVVMDE